MLGILCWAGSATAETADSETYSIGAVPAWVVQTPLPDPVEVNRAESRDGVFGLLHEEQVYALGGGASSFHRTALLVDNAAGIETAGEFSVTFNPSFQTLVLHGIEIHRAGARIDALGRAEIKLIQRERGMENRIYDGRQSVVASLEDVRVGDVVVWSYTRTGRNPVFGAAFLDGVFLENDWPFSVLRTRLLWPTDRPLYTRNHLTDIQPSIHRGSLSTEYVWERRDVPARVPDDDLPDWYDPYAWVQLSSFKSWEEVARWGVAVFSYDPDDPELARQVAEIEASHADLEGRLLAALAFVQDEVRYLAFSIGAHTHQPFEPGLVLERRFGDCKDKALLLTSLLRALGIDAAPALVSTQYRARVDSWHPSPYAFNHAIVWATLKGKEYWLDATRVQERGPLASRPGADYGAALVLRPQTSELTKVQVEQTTPGKLEVEYRFEARAFDAPVSFRVRTIYLGLEANRIRASLLRESRNLIADAYLKYYAKTYPGIESLAPLEVIDDASANRLVTEESYRIPDFFEVDRKDGRQIGAIYSNEIASELVLPASLRRTMPLRVRHPRHVVQTTEVVLPERLALSESSAIVDDPAFRFRYERSLNGRNLRLRYEYQSRSDFVPASRTAAYAENIDRARSTLQYEFWKRPSTGRGVPGPVIFVVFGIALGLVALRWLAFAGLRLLQCGYVRLAVPVLAFAHGATRLIPIRGFAAVNAINLAAAESTLGHFDRAERLHNQLLARTPRTHPHTRVTRGITFASLANMYLGEERYAEAFQAAERADREMPGTGNAREHLFVQATLAEAERCLGRPGDARRTLSREPFLGGRGEPSPACSAVAAAARGDLGDAAEAERELLKVIAEIPQQSGDHARPLALRLLADLLCAGGRHSEAHARYAECARFYDTYGASESPFGRAARRARDRCRAHAEP